MAELDDKVIVTKSKITDIADALREEMSESNEYSLPTMVQKVHELGQGQGSEYTGGVGIDITNRVVSVVDTLMIRGSANGSVASIDDGADDIPLKSCIVAIEPVQSGSGDPSPQNERPITGWTECNLNHYGKSLIDTSTLELNKYLNSYGQTDNSGASNVTGYLDVESNKIYIFAFDFTTLALASIRNICFYDNNKTFLSYLNYTSSVDLKNITINTPNNAKYIRITTDKNYTDMSLNEDTIYNIEFPSEAGTVYGGTLDVVNGVLTVTDEYIASYNGETLPSTWISSMDVYAEGTTPTTGAEVVYKLATPQTYNVTPTEVKTLLGINNIFADCGDVDVEYVRDATLIINKLLELASGNNNRMMMKSAVVEKADEEQKKDSVEENLDA